MICIGETTNSDLIRLDDAGKLRKFKKPLYKSLSSFATVIKPELINDEKRLGNDISLCNSKMKKKF